MSTNQKFQEAKNKLVSEASNHATRYLLGRYGSAHLIGEPIVELTSQVNPISNAVEFNGVIKVQAAPTGLLNQIGVNMTVNSNDIEVESENIQADITEAINAQAEHSDVVVASLDSFKLHDDGSKYLKVSHSALQDANLGIVGKNEWAASPDKAELLCNMVKDAMLETPITFTGEFKEPTIEKVAEKKPHTKECNDKNDHSVKEVCICDDGKGNEKVASSDTHEHNCEECGDMWKCHKGQACNEGKNAPCGKDYAKKEFGTKKSWLTADFDGPEMELPEEAKQEVLESYSQPGANTPNAHFYYFNVADGKLYDGTFSVWDDEMSNKNYEYVYTFDTGEFSKNPLFSGETPLHPSATVAIKENMPMARATDHLAQATQLEEQLISASSEKIKNEAANALISMLHTQGFGTAKIAEITKSNSGYDIMTTVDSDGALRAVSIPVSIKDGKIVLPKKSLVSILISKGLDVKAKLSEQFDLDLLEKLAAIDEKMAYETKEANDILADRPATAVVKEAAGEKQPFFDSDDSTMTLNKHLLPDHEDYKVGDILSDGTDEYEIVNTSGQQNDKNEGSSSQWTLKKRQAPLRDDKEPKNKMPS